ncbi:Hypothetical predicted protein [Scomber scombrus]|uniref:Uncharacterized protein n=1 Tax=Scomber scombrus TaxID=13677 RepID=A0AAV1MSL7_SCOSC
MRLSRQLPPVRTTLRVTLEVMLVSRKPSDHFALLHSCVRRGETISVINGEGQAGTLCPGQPHTHNNTCLKAAVSMTTPDKIDYV